MTTTAELLGGEQPPKVVGLMSEGRPIVLMPTHHEMTTNDVASFLNVSRPFVIKEVEAGRLHHRKVGTHRRIACEDEGVASANELLIRSA